MKRDQDWWSAQGAAQLTAALVFLLGATGIVVLVNRNERIVALREARQSAIRLLDRNTAAHDYINEVMIPAARRVRATAADDGFDPTWMSSIYAVREIGKRFNASSGELYYYKR